ncbi:MAG: HesA/MoeB/ThiF family protein [Desulfohalobiaceae bacterium]
MRDIDSEVQGLCSLQEGGMSGISSADLGEISRRHGLTLLQAEIRALELGIVPVKYLRNMQGFSLQEQLKLLRSRLAMVGLGGLGGVLLELLSRLGVGRIKAADGDVFAEHNLNRQLLCSTDNLGRSKAEAAQARCRQVNPAVELETVPGFLQEEDYPEFLQGQDLVLDALGGLQVRRILQNQAGNAGLVLVSGALAGEMGYVSTVSPGDPGLLPFLQGAAGAEEDLGCLPHAVFAVASAQCAEAAHILCGRKAQLRGGVALLDLEGFSGWEFLRLE